MRIVLLAASAILAASIPGMASETMTILDESTFPEIRRHIEPSKAETEWREIPWRTTFWNAVADAQRQERPILLWAMNGHPLACT